MLSRIKWESIDGFRPPDGSLKHVPKSEHAALARAKAQKKNNALAALSWEAPNSGAKKRQRVYCHHFPLGRPIPPYNKSCHEISLIKTRPAAIELIRFDLKRRIFEEIGLEDRICLALTSKMMMRSLGSFQRDYASDDEDEDESERKPLARFSINDHSELMKRLSKWMPSLLDYCYHCLTYVARSSFGPQTEDLDRLACMDCRFYACTTPQPNPCPHCGGTDKCIGCMSLELAFWSYMEEHPDMDEGDAWDRLFGTDLHDLPPATQGNDA